LIADITINFLFSENFASIDNIIRKYNLVVDLSKFTFNKKNIRQVCWQTLFLFLFFGEKIIVEF